ncbi:hypothetical protein DID78_03745 [Candidatus Marinamargulisbacteria bacterium SCGC AG-343-D04]|nr:hypothetical protein DID78_03745 [Candidatus Marinamargulisbacteria bacterium SCGC AG-343-D04]
MSDLQLDYDKNEPNSKLIFLSVGITILILVAVSILSYYFFVASLSQDRDKKQLLQKNVMIQALERDYDVNLNKLGWVNKNKGIIKIPIEDAIHEVVKDYN